MPSKITASGAFVFKNFGLISFDYSRKDYGSMKFKPENDNYFSNLNQNINLSLTEINTYRIGAEIISDRFSFRGGYMTQDSPYNSSSSNTTAVAYDNNVDDLDVIDEEAAAIMTFIKFHPKRFVNLYSSCHDGQEYSNTKKPGECNMNQKPIS